MQKRIFIVDDSPEVLALLSELLTAAGYMVITQAFPLANTDQLRRAAPDLIIIDYWLGNEEVRHRTMDLIMQSADLAQLPLIICTGYADEPMMEESQLRRNNVMVLHKPFDVDDLLDKVMLMITFTEETKHHYIGATMLSDDRLSRTK